MKSKYLAYIKNAIIATGATIAAGVGASELTSYFTDNGKIIGTISTITQYITGWASFLPLQAWDNRDVYTKNNKFDYKEFLWDNLKLGTAFILIDIGYVAGRPFLQNFFIEKGATPVNSSLLADLIFIPASLTLGVGLARLTGVIKSKKTLEKRLSQDTL